MGNEITNLDKLHKSAREIIEPYAKELVELLGDNIRSVIVYGSSIGEAFIPKRSNINLLVVCREITVAELKKCHKLVLKGRKKGIIAPLFLTQTHMETSSDVFPIEFLDMADFHQTIYGEDALSNLEIAQENLRLECEEQLKGKLIRIRQAYLESGADYKAVNRILKDSISSLIPILRGILRLTNKTPHFIKSDVISSVGKDFGIDTGIFLKVLSLKTGELTIPKSEIEETFEEYIKEIEKLAIIIDKLKR